MIFGVLSVLAAAVLVGVDQLIKRWATAVLLPKTAMTLIPGVLELRYFLNDGMAFSMLAGKQKLLIAATSLMLLGVLWMLFARKLTPLERVAWTLVLGGGIGNLIDRIATGVVVDYINVLFMNFAIFNFADICVCVGVGLLMVWVLFDSYFKEKAEKSVKTESAAPADDANGSDPRRQLCQQKRQSCPRRCLLYRPAGTSAHRGPAPEHPAGCRLRG